MLCSDEWWLMKEAKARNPALKLYGLPWGWPGWLDPSASATVEAKNAFANPDVTANYTLGKIQISRRSEARPQPSARRWAVCSVSARGEAGARPAHRLHGAVERAQRTQVLQRRAPEGRRYAARSLRALMSAAVRNPMWQARLRS